ncbi:retrovirus-related pol polyprotein from transposon tnt 1-94 [Salvia divinorum]|uniref:Retrovirus-related pol polyprotein from transposon tnt 1-94 n=1 Tax=Salvia divinorum TaxID=28513 RepID=A0ABD1GMM1_SALDI
MMYVLLLSSELPQNMWGEAILTENYILNKIPLKSKDVTPYELWKGMKPSYKYLKVWECLAKVMVPPPKVVTIGPKTVDYIFIGYALNSSAYRFVVYKSNIPNVTVGTTIESRNAVFLEKTFSCKNKDNVESNSETRIEDETTSSKSVDVEPNSRKRSRTDPEDVEPRRGSRVRTSKTFGPSYIAFKLDDKPTSLKVAFASPDGLHWKEAVQS